MAIAQYMPSRAGSPQPGLARVEEARRAAALVPVGARRAAADAGCRSSRRASDGGRLSPLFGRAAGGSPALHDSAYSPLRRGSDSASRRVALWLAGRRLRSRSASPRPRRSPLQLPLSVAAPPPSQPPAADAGSRGDRGVQHSRQQQRADATFDLRLSIPAFPCGFLFPPSPTQCTRFPHLPSTSPTMPPDSVSRLAGGGAERRRNYQPEPDMEREQDPSPARTWLGIARLHARYLTGGAERRQNYSEKKCSFPQPEPGLVSRDTSPAAPATTTSRSAPSLKSSASACDTSPVTACAPSRSRPWQKSISGADLHRQISFYIHHTVSVKKFFLWLKENRMNSSVGSAGRMMEEVANEGSDVLGERNMKEQQSNKDDVCVERAMEQVSSHDDDLLREALLETGLFTGVVSIDPMHKKVERYKQKVSWDVFHMVTLQ
uniref:Uncharacterized protein n=1 Tax=Oryza glumipatula TaxID=40148 RepID=A0A0D9Y9S8_9ORYZ